MRGFRSGKLSKSELLELMIAQKKEIERLENDVQSLTQEVAIRDQKIKEMTNLVQVTKTLIHLTKKIDEKLTNFGGNENE